MERKKILVLSDHPLVPSGVGIQTKYLIEGLLKTEKYKFLCLGGAIQHPSMQPQMIAPDQFGEGNWIIYPVIGHGDKQILRKFMSEYNPDAVLLVTDPRFFVWVWEMEDEIRSQCPILYWHVWDNDPSPKYNQRYYNATDAIGCISLKTYGLLQDLKHKNFSYIPHGEPEDLFKPLPKEETEPFRKNFGIHGDKKFIVMWNNRNARRKQTGDVIATFAKFAKKVGKDKTSLLMHTAIGDTEGQNIIEVAKEFDIEDCLIVSEQRVQPELMNQMYNFADVVINISSNEGFGLSTLEALFCGKLVVVHMTGGLQYQVGDWYEDIKDFTNQDKLTAGALKRWSSNIGNWWGAPIFTASRSCTGSQDIPYIYDDRVSHDDVVKALLKVYNMKKSDRKELGLKAREWAKKTFSLDNMISEWDNLITKTLHEYTPVGVRTAVL